MNVRGTKPIALPVKNLWCVIQQICNEQ